MTETRLRKKVVDGITAYNGAVTVKFILTVNTYAVLLPRNSRA